MNAMNAKMMAAEFNSAEVRAAVGAYLLAKAYALTMRERVDKIAAEILAEVPLYNDLEVQFGQERRRLTHGRSVYLSEDAAGRERFYAESDARTRAAGLKPADMPRDYCPACVAETLLMDARRVLIDTSGRAFGVSADSITGIDHQDQWVELVVGFVLNCTDYKPPRIDTRTGVVVSGR